MTVPLGCMKESPLHSLPPPAQFHHSIRSLLHLSESPRCCLSPAARPVGVAFTSRHSACCVIALHSVPATNGLQLTSTISRQPRSCLSLCSSINNKLYLAFAACSTTYRIRVTYDHSVINSISCASAASKPQPPHLPCFAVKCFLGHSYVAGCRRPSHGSLIATAVWGSPVPNFCEPTSTWTPLGNRNLHCHSCNCKHSWITTKMFSYYTP